jgi:hypothetical protein
LQNNYKNLKEFILKYNELEKENQELKKEIIKLKQKNNELLSLKANKTNYLNNYKYNKYKYKKYIIEKQSGIDIISLKRVHLIYRQYNHNKKNGNLGEFFTLGSIGKENNDNCGTEKNGELKNNKLKNLFKKKENNDKYYLFKKFIKFYYNGIYNQNISNCPTIFNNIK